MPNDIVKSAGTYFRRFNVNESYFQDLPPEDLSLIVVIPAYKEPDILPTLDSLNQCLPPKGTTELIIVINAPENASEGTLQTNRSTVEQISGWKTRLSSVLFSLKLIREEQLPEKFTGAGLARKIGMDEALRRWALAGTDGPILCLDADCTVSSDYLVSAEKAFSNPLIQLAHYQFKHLYLDEKDDLLRNGIIQYELHLRYHIQGLKWAGFPNAKHTVGSCMAVRASTYARSGGMNRRKAGEDFYFMHKLLPVNRFVYLLAIVFPSCRSSDRVPFGTGRAQLEFMDAGVPIRSTYHPESYFCMQQFFALVPKFYKAGNCQEIVPNVLKLFLKEQNFENRVADMKSKSNSLEKFLKNFWQWMDGFMVLKMTHFLRDSVFSELPIDVAANSLLKAFDGEQSSLSLADLLEKYRQLDLDCYSNGATVKDI